MNYPGQSPRGISLEQHNFLVDMEFIFECPPSPAREPHGRRGAMGDDSLWIRTKLIDSSKLRKSSHSSLRSLPPSPMGIPLGKGPFTFSDPEGPGIKPLRIKPDYKTLI
jgi:hypothetical protein